MICSQKVSVVSNASHLVGNIATIVSLIGKICCLLFVRACRAIARSLLWCLRQLGRFRPFNPLWGVIVSLMVIEGFTIGIGIFAEVSFALTVYSIFHTALICGVVALLIWFDSATEKRRPRRRRSGASITGVVKKIKRRGYSANEG